MNRSFLKLFNKEKFKTNFVTLKRLVTYDISPVSRNCNPHIGAPSYLKDPAPGPLRIEEIGKKIYVYINQAEPERPIWIDSQGFNNRKQAIEGYVFESLHDYSGKWGKMPSTEGTIRNVEKDCRDHLSRVSRPTYLKYRYQIYQVWFWGLVCVGFMIYLLMHFSDVRNLKVPQDSFPPYWHRPELIDDGRVYGIYGNIWYEEGYPVPEGAYVEVPPDKD